MLIKRRKLGQGMQGRQRVKGTCAFTVNAYTTDIDNQSADNYSYDAIGNLLLM
ncbi:hypothetical protein [Parafilimonas terrae]|uniref:hypothetical protein n=1 Tax=Parafilimonas terrae TaxID=1465490 RepID=UPI0015A7004F|nr:hypothetical protein [Parafilimonas terrae]